MSVARAVSAQPRHPLLTGIAAGLLAGVVTGQVDRLFDRFVSPAQKRRDRQVREAPAHLLAGPYFARKITGRRLSGKEFRRAQLAFSAVYGVVWGMIHAGARRKAPAFSRLGGLPFGVPFFFACDGTMAPLLGVSPNLRKIPWQMNAKELGNHIVWTATAELVHRAAARMAPAR
jgi:putative membrane protein